MSGEPVDDGPSVRATVVQDAWRALVAAVEEMRRTYELHPPTSDLLQTIKQAMHVKVPPHDFTVIQALCERERQNVFSEMADTKFPVVRNEFDKTIQGFLNAGESRTPARKSHWIARNAWKEDPGADRRIREMKLLPPDEWRSPYRGRPELYDPGVICAFEGAIARAAGRNYVAWTRSIEDNKSRGAMLDVLVAAVRWAMCIAWQSSAPPGRNPPEVKAEGLLKIVKTNRR